MQVQKGSPFIFDEWIEPTSRLIIFGAGHDVIPVVEFASKAGFDVTIVDQRQELLNYNRFPGAVGFVHSYPDEYEEKLPLMANDYVLFMSHRINYDAAAFRVCYRYPVKYLGFLGPKSRTEQIKEMVGIDIGFLNRIQHRIFAPIGLDIGSETAEQVALSIVSELLAIKKDRPATSLREKNGNIHDGKPDTSRSIGGLN
ncbi:XdhC family protein [Peribacillus cavernae]|nr:XdhC family protein [Peribacillus cavernae]